MADYDGDMDNEPDSWEQYKQNQERLKFLRSQSKKTGEPEYTLYGRILDDVASSFVGTWKDIDPIGGWILEHLQSHMMVKHLRPGNESENQVLRKEREKAKETIEKLTKKLEAKNVKIDQLEKELERVTKLHQGKAPLETATNMTPPAVAGAAAANMLSPDAPPGSNTSSLSSEKKDTIATMLHEVCDGDKEREAALLAALVGGVTVDTHEQGFTIDGQAINNIDTYVKENMDPGSFHNIVMHLFKANIPNQVQRFEHMDRFIKSEKITHMLDEVNMTPQELAQLLFGFEKGEKTEFTLEKMNDNLAIKKSNDEKTVQEKQSVEAFTATLFPDEMSPEILRKKFVDNEEGTLATTGNLSSYLNSGLFSSKDLETILERAPQHIEELKEKARAKEQAENAATGTLHKEKSDEEKSEKREETKTTNDKHLNDQAPPSEHLDINKITSKDEEKKNVKSVILADIIGDKKHYIEILKKHLKEKIKILKIVKDNDKEPLVLELESDSYEDVKAAIAVIKEEYKAKESEASTLSKEKSESDSSSTEEGKTKEDEEIVEEAGLEEVVEKREEAILEETEHEKDELVVIDIMSDKQALIEQLARHDTLRKGLLEEINLLREQHDLETIQPSEIDAQKGKAQTTGKTNTLGDLNLGALKGIRNSSGNEELNEGSKKPRETPNDHLKSQEELLDQDGNPKKNDEKGKER